MLLFVSLILLVLQEIYATENCTLNFCNGTHSSQSQVKLFCQNETSESYMLGRCCIENETEAIIGLDLTSCGIENLKISEYDFTDLLIMDLRDNELKSVSPHDLIGLLNLTYLYLPDWLPCPGGKEAWNETHPNVTYCHSQNNPCVYLNISCTDNGNCIHKGPGSAKCVCKPGHYGYKCLNEGEFPNLSFSICITVATVILSVMLWFAQGRDAYKKR